MQKTERQLERIVKGFANHRRIQMLALLERQPELSVEEICEKLRIGTKTASEHLRRLSIAWLVVKRNEGRWVRHKITKRGSRVLAFLRSLD